MEARDPEQDPYSSAGFCKRSGGIPFSFWCAKDHGTACKKPSPQNDPFPGFCHPALTDSAELVERAQPKR